jgi:hypothetical protein
MMPTSAHLPSSVIAFLNQHVDHIVKLEFLLTVHGAPSSTTTVPLAARQLDVSKSQIRAMADELADEGLLRVSSDRLELAPINVEDRRAISHLAFSYQRDRELVLQVLKVMGRS